MGISVRTKASLDFDLAPLVWKLLAGEMLTVDDVVATDYRLGVLLRRIQTFSAVGAAGGAGAGAGAASPTPTTPAATAAGESAFAAEFPGMRFVVPAVGATGAAIGGMALVPGGDGLAVTLGNRDAFITAVLSRFARRYKGATDHMRQGLTCIIPERALQTCTWKELARLTCGEPDVDLDVLKRNTAFDSRGIYSERHPVIRNFWTVMESLTPEQRKNFVRFSWGRSKLPRGAWPKNSKGEQVKFKIVPKLGYTGLPLAHTCFFLIELPDYPTLDMMRQRLMVAITYGASEGFLIA